MPTRDIIVIGASAGGVEALSQIVRGLPADLPAAIFVVLHVSPHSTSVLPTILNRRGPLPAAHPSDGERIENGRIYVAPPDLHLLVKRGYIRLAHGPKENRHRPAVDPLFRTAARAYGSRVVGVVLSGTLDDGTAGLLTVKSRNGMAIVQDPEEALYDGMPRSAIENVKVDFVLSLSEIVPELVRLSYEQVKENPDSVHYSLAIESDMAELDMEAVQNNDRPGEESPYSCPECGGVLWELNDGNLLRFRCRTGHAFASESLLAEQSEALEQALWVALRALKEQSDLTRRLAKRAEESSNPRTALRYKEQAEEVEMQAEVIRKVLLNNPGSEPKPSNSTESNHINDGRDR